MKTVCIPCYHHNGFVVTHALGHMVYGYKLLVAMNQGVFKELRKKYNVNIRLCLSC